MNTKLTRQTNGSQFSVPFQTFGIEVSMITSLKDLEELDTFYSKSRAQMEADIIQCEIEHKAFVEKIQQMSAPTTKVVQEKCSDHNI